MTGELTPYEYLERTYAKVLLAAGVSIREVGELLDSADLMEKNWTSSPGEFTVPAEAIPYLRKYENGLTLPLEHWAYYGLPPLKSAKCSIRQDLP